MNLNKRIARVEGPNIALRVVQADDATYIYGLRTDSIYNQYLSEVKGTVENQRLWIEKYKVREAALQEIYYVIERQDGIRCGLVRLYSICNDSFTWGSWVLDHNKPRLAALESAVLSFGVGFDCLGLPTAQVDVRIANEHAVKFYRRLGMSEIRRDARDIYFAYTRAQFEADRAGYMAILEKKCAE